jgi:hypothetical protein
MSNNKSTGEILFSYFSYLILFVGSAFISGAIVHSGNVSEVAKYAVFGVVGVSLFIAGSFIQEFILNKENLKQEGVVKFFFFSLLLSIGIGMISGGTQHYSDFPTYSSYLIPLGLTLSLIAYFLKNNYHLTIKLWASIVGVFVIISIPLHFGLITLANNLNAQSAKDKAAICAKKTSFNPFVISVQASSDHGEVKCQEPINTRQQIVHDMGSNVMPFSINNTVHIFEKTITGGIQTIEVKDPKNTIDLPKIRDHLQKEVANFNEGNFEDPSKVHGANMPGLDILKTNYSKLKSTYLQTPAGAKITYESSDEVTKSALYSWFDAQLSDHGDDAMSKMTNINNISAKPSVQLPAMHDEADGHTGH